MRETSRSRTARYRVRSALSPGKSYIRQARRGKAVKFGVFVYDGVEPIDLATYSVLSWPMPRLSRPRVASRKSNNKKKPDRPKVRKVLCPAASHRPGQSRNVRDRLSLRTRRLMFDRVLMARRCRKRAAEYKSLAETAMTAEERGGHLIVAEHYNALAEAAERSVKATLEERFPRMRTA